MTLRILLFLFIAACATGPKPVIEPAPEVSTKSKDHSPRHSQYREFLNLTPEQLTERKFEKLDMERWRQHRIALGYTDTEPAKSCPYWLELSKDVNYPLNKLAQLRHQLICEKTPMADLEFSTDEQIIYEDILVVRDLAHSAQTETLDDDVQATLAQARLTTHFQDREELFKKALQQARRSRNKELIKTAELALYKNSPRLNPRPEPQELMSVASNHRQWREFDKALRIYRRILKSSKFSAEDHYKALKAIRMTLKTAQRRNEYVDSTSKLAKWAFQQWKKNKRDPWARKRYHDSQMLLVRTLWTEDRTSQAMKTLEQTEKQLAGRYPLDELFFIRSRIYEEKKNFEMALKFLEKALAEKNGRKDIRDKILWAQAWLLYKNEKYDKALTSFKELSENATEESDRNRSKYWLARTQIKLTQTDEAKETLKAVAKDDPLGIYGLLALRELGEKIPPLKIQDSSEADERISNQRIPSDVEALAVITDWLVATGEQNFAEKALNRLSENLRRLDHTREETWLKVFSQYAQSGSYLPLFFAMGQLKPEMRESILADHPEFLFPQPYRDIVQTAAEKAGIQSSLIYSIMRQESAFNPKARSPVDAYGLMQLLPSVAKVRAQHVGVPYKTATDLYDPQINVPLGAEELKALFKKYDDQYILAISAYNASERALRGWLKMRYRLDPIEFIEEIPYEETRNYVKLVLRNYIFYQRFSSPEPFDFPEYCLKLEQAYKAHVSF